MAASLVICWTRRPSKTKRIQMMTLNNLRILHLCWILNKIWKLMKSWKTSHISNNFSFLPLRAKLSSKAELLLVKWKWRWRFIRTKTQQQMTRTLVSRRYWITTLAILLSKHKFLNSEIRFYHHFSSTGATDCRNSSWSISHSCVAKEPSEHSFLQVFSALISWSPRYQELFSVTVWTAKCVMKSKKWRKRGWIEEDYI